MRQSRDKGPSETDTSDDDHRAIPRDAEGAPIFLILPPSLRAEYEKRMAQCEAAWREGEPLAAAEAVKWADIHRQPNPKWIGQAVIELAIGRRTAKQAKRYAEAGIRLRRYMLVRDLKIGVPGLWPQATWITGDLAWEKVFERAAELSVGTAMAASAATFKADYCAVKRDHNAGRSGKYFLLKDWRYRLNGKPDPNGPSEEPA
jgi:hypothetical protein